MESTAGYKSPLTLFFFRQEFTALMEALNGGLSSAGITNGTAVNGFIRSSSFGSSRASTPSPTMGKLVVSEPGITLYVS